MSDDNEPEIEQQCALPFRYLTGHKYDEQTKRFTTFWSDGTEQVIVCEP